MPNRMLMALGILQGYLRHPVLFLLTTWITLPGFTGRLPPELPQEFVQVAALQTWIYVRLKAQTGQQTAYEVVRACVQPIGLAVQQRSFRAVEAPRSFENLVAFQQRTNREGPTRWNEMEIVEQSAHRYEFRVTGCLCHELNSRLGIPELTALTREVDNALFGSYLPVEVTFHRNGPGNRIAGGAPACHFVLECRAPRREARG